MATGLRLPKTVLTSAVFLIASLCVQGRDVKEKAQRKKVPLFFFGDSLFDVGNNNYLPATPYQCNFYPYGITALPDSGRWSNGRVIPDFIAEYLNIPSPHSYERYLHKGGSTTHGLNFASGAAGVLNSTHFNQTYSLPFQLTSFLQLRDSKKISNESASNAIYVINVGSNDILAAPKNPAEIPAYFGNIVSAYAQFVLQLYYQGARKFVHSTIPPVGCTPYIRAVLGESPPLGCNVAINNLTYALNSAIVEQLLNPSFIFKALPAKLVIYDQFASTLNTIGHKRKFGYNSTKGCCGGPGAYFPLVPCGVPQYIQGTLVNYTLCTDIDKHFFWDWFHPTESAARIAAKYIWSGGMYTSPSGGAKATFW